jgi:hypothetical protein
MRFSDARGDPPPSDRLIFPSPNLQHQWLANRSTGHHMPGANRPPAFSFGEDPESSRRPGDSQKSHFAASARDQLGPSMVLDSRLSESSSPMHIFADNFRNSGVDMQYLRHNQTGPALLDSKSGINKSGKKQLKENDAIEYLNQARFLDSILFFMLCPLINDVIWDR